MQCEMHWTELRAAKFQWKLYYKLNRSKSKHGKSDFFLINCVIKILWTSHYVAYLYHLPWAFQLELKSIFGDSLTTSLLIKVKLSSLFHVETRSGFAVEITDLIRILVSPYLEPEKQRQLERYKNRVLFILRMLKAAKLSNATTYVGLCLINFAFRQTDGV